MADLYFFSGDCFARASLAMTGKPTATRHCEERSNPPKIIEFHPHSFLLHIMFIKFNRTKNSTKYLYSLFQKIVNF